jgi:hypothetical protein
MCYNGPKSWQLGWYSDYHVDLSPNNYNWSVDLVGFAEKDNTNMMIIRIKDASTSNTDTYVHFNRKIGFDSETKEGGNHVLVGTRKSGIGYGASTLRAKLNSNGVYAINGIGGTVDSVTITVNSIDTSSTPARANVSMQLVQQPTQAPVVPTTGAPLVPPTEAPRTDAPVVAPTKAPVLSPSGAPSVSPSNKPSMIRSEITSPSPSGRPSKVASRSPSSASSESPPESDIPSPTP